MQLRTMKEIRALEKNIPNKKTPYLLMDLENLREKSKAFQSAFPKTIIYYALKANPQPDILKIFFQESIHFDVASWGEIEYLRALGIPADKIIFSAPTKIPEHIQLAFNYGVRSFAFDSRLELEKISRLAPSSKVIARLIVKNTGSEWPLEKKFGMDGDETIELMVEAKRSGLVPWGITFHVGSQNSRPQTWTEALEHAGEIAKALSKKGIHLGMVNAGGGFPAQYCKEIPCLEEISSVILKSKAEFFGSKVQLCVEPGRGLVAEAGVMAATVINRTIRNGENWLYIDAGIFHGLYEAHEGFNYPILTSKEKDPRSEFTIAGPSCDSVDIFMENTSLPSTLTVGDVIYFQTAGAYTTGNERYNGMDYPPIYMVKK